MGRAQALTGFVIFLLLGAGVLGALLRWARPGREAVALVGAALLLAASGFVLQGSPGLAGSPTPPRANHPAADPLFAAERKVWLGQAGPDAAVLASADALIARGQPDRAIATLRDVLALAPDDMDLWIGLGNALATHADGQVTPAARYAFARAAAVAPGSPVPGYFLGLAYLGAGDRDSAERIWRGLLATTRSDAPEHKLIAIRLEALGRMRPA